jgi:hypothetical protein
VLATRLAASVIKLAGVPELAMKTGSHESQADVRT